MFGIVRPSNNKQNKKTTHKFSVSSYKCINYNPKDFNVAGPTIPSTFNPLKV